RHNKRRRSGGLALSTRHRRATRSTVWQRYSGAWRSSVIYWLTGDEHQALRDAAASRGLDEAALIHSWITRQGATRRRGRRTSRWSGPLARMRSPRPLGVTVTVSVPTT